MTRHRKKPRFKKLRSMYIWHRYIGVSVAVLVIVLSVTGLMLNHTEELALDEQHIGNDWLLDHYGIHAPETIASFSAAGHWISQWGERLFFDQQELGSSNKPLIGVVAYEDMLVLALQSEVWLLTTDGELIEKMGGLEGIPAGMSAIGISDEGRVAVMAAHGVYTTDEDLVIWEDDPEAITVWVDPVELPQALAQALLAKYRGHGLSLERVTLDLHSGRIFGPYGVYVMDAAAVLMLFLALSGTWIWGMRHVRNLQRNKLQPRKK